MLSDVIYEDAGDEAEAGVRGARGGRRRRQEEGSWCQRLSPQRRCIYICLGAVLCVLLSLMVAIVTLQVVYHSSGQDAAVLATSQIEADVTSKMTSAEGVMTLRPTTLPSLVPATRVSAPATRVSAPATRVSAPAGVQADILDEPSGGPWNGAPGVGIQRPTERPRQTSGAGITTQGDVLLPSSVPTLPLAAGSTPSAAGDGGQPAILGSPVTVRPLGPQSPAPIPDEAQGPPGLSGPHGAPGSLDESLGPVGSLSDIHDTSGPQGAPGPPGPSGPHGPSGPQGPTGPPELSEAHGEPGSHIESEGQHSRASEKEGSERGRISGPRGDTRHTMRETESLLHVTATTPKIMTPPSTRGRPVSPTIHTVAATYSLYPPTVPPSQAPGAVTRIHHQRPSLPPRPGGSHPPKPGLEGRPRPRPRPGSPGLGLPPPLGGPRPRPPPRPGGKRPPRRRKIHFPSDCDPKPSLHHEGDEGVPNLESQYRNDTKDCEGPSATEYRAQIKDIMLYLLMSLFGLGVSMVVITVISVKVMDARKRGGCQCYGCSCCSLREESVGCGGGSSRSAGQQVQVELNMSELSRSSRHSHTSSSNEDSQHTPARRNSTLNMHSMHRLAVGSLRDASRANRERTYSVETNISDPPSYNEAVGMGVPGMVIETIASELPGQGVIVYQPPSYEDVILSGASLPS